MMTDGNSPYCGDHFGISMNIEALGCMPETNTIFVCQLFFNINK